MRILRERGAIGSKLLLFSGAARLSDALWDRSGVRWSPRPHAPALGAPQRALDPKLWHFVLETSGLKCILAYVSTDGSGRARGVGACARPEWTPSDLGETLGPRIDRIQPARPPWRCRQYRELKTLIFSPPRKCPSGLFGPLANRTILKRLHVHFVLLASMSCNTLALLAPGSNYLAARCVTLQL